MFAQYNWLRFLFLDENPKDLDIEKISEFGVEALR